MEEENSWKKQKEGKGKENAKWSSKLILINSDESVLTSISADLIQQIRNMWLIIQSMTETTWKKSLIIPDLKEISPLILDPFHLNLIKCEDRVQGINALYQGLHELLEGL